MAQNENKADFRAEAQRRVTEITPGERAEFSGAICRQLAEMKEFAEATGVCFFMPLPSEPDLVPLMRAVWTRDGEVSVPCSWGGGGPYVPCLMDEVTELVTGPDGILQPESFDPVNPGNVSLILAPGIAFDATGVRLGRGGGHYDRMISAFRCANPACVFAGVCFDVQVLEALPLAKNDEPMDLVITEKRIIRCSRGEHCKGVS